MKNSNITFLFDKFLKNSFRKCCFRMHFLINNILKKQKFGHFGSHKIYRWRCRKFVLVSWMFAVSGKFLFSPDFISRGKNFFQFTNFLRITFCMMIKYVWNQILQCCPSFDKSKRIIFGWILALPALQKLEVLFSSKYSRKQMSCLQTYFT